MIKRLAIDIFKFTSTYFYSNNNRIITIISLYHVTDHHLRKKDIENKIIISIATCTYIHIYITWNSVLLSNFFQIKEIFHPSTIIVETKPCLVLDNQFEIAIVSTWSSNLSFPILSLLPLSLSLSLFLSWSRLLKRRINTFRIRLTRNRGRR